MTAATVPLVADGDRQQGLSVRVVSGFVLAALALAAAFFGGWGFNLLVAAAGVSMAWEWDRLSGGRGIGALSILHAATIGAVVGLAATGNAVWAVLALAVGAVAAAVGAQATARRAGWAVAGLVYTSVPALAAVWLRAEEELGRVAVLWLFAVIWSTDIAAYFVGRAVGGPKLAPRISPGKTWAGFWGGLAAACLAGFVVAFAAGLGPLWALIGFSAALSLAGQGGDLAISRVKRHFHVKDSGTLIPGHGGVLDRLDSTLASLPLVAAALLVLEAGGLRWP